MGVGSILGYGVLFSLPCVLLCTIHFKISAMRKEKEERSRKGHRGQSEPSPCPEEGQALRPRVAGRGTVSSTPCHGQCYVLLGCAEQAPASQMPPRALLHQQQAHSAERMPRSLLGVPCRAPRGCARLLAACCSR